MRNRFLLTFFILHLSFFTSIAFAANDLTRYVDPMIGSEGVGRVVIGPSCPFGMVKPSPDCTVAPNSGWLPMPTQVNGFSQTHVSGTGGGPKYGNVLVMPYNSPSLYIVDGKTTGDEAFWVDYRMWEKAELGYYATKFSKSGITTEVTTSERASIYRCEYPQWGEHCMLVDAGFFLGENPVPKAREAQQFEGSAMMQMANNAVGGFTSISGGWNNGGQYTVFFYCETSEDFLLAKKWGEFGNDNLLIINDRLTQNHTKTGCVLRFAGNPEQVLMKVGISFVSIEQAKRNAQQINGFDFDGTLALLKAKWQSIFERMTISEKSTEAQKRMFYTAIYHTMIEPVDRTGENPKWQCDEPYYDDFYALWDTYRTSLPLITLIDQQKEVDIVRSLIDIYEHDGFMPDARSGNSNGRTQGGSNAEVVIADAFVKNLKGIDYEKGLRAMLKDAEVAPEDDEAEGRGGLKEYNALGFVPYGIDRAGNRTVEYSLCDYCIAVVADGLHKQGSRAKFSEPLNAIADKYFKKAHNWQNLWRSDYEHDGVRGFIMPRTADGKWIDDAPYGDTSMGMTFRYTPTTNEAPWNNKWWGTFFYEATSWEYSMSMTHDIPLLVEICGGKEAFEKRLDTFFAKKYYNVGNEPSFLSPCLYHWAGKPDKTSACVHKIINECYNDSHEGLPGNDDSGAMSSWLAFHMIGLYPNAGTDEYILHAPMVESCTITLANGKKFTINTNGFAPNRTRISKIMLNGKAYPHRTIKHSDIMNGGVLTLHIK